MPICLAMAISRPFLLALLGAVLLAAAAFAFQNARKGARGPLRLLAPFVLHEGAAHEGDGEDLTPAAQAVLRHGAALNIIHP